jgi:hypothetical protein
VRLGGGVLEGVLRVVVGQPLQEHLEVARRVGVEPLEVDVPVDPAAQERLVDTAGAQKECDFSNFSRNN